MNLVRSDIAVFVVLFYLKPAERILAAYLTAKNMKTKDHKHQQVVFVYTYYDKYLSNPWTLYFLKHGIGIDSFRSPGYSPIQKDSFIK